MPAPGTSALVVIPKAILKTGLLETVSENHVMLFPACLLLPVDIIQLVGITHVLRHK